MKLKMGYEIIDVDALGRIGKLTINNKEIMTPNIFPVVHPSKNVISAKEMKDFGAQALFTNSYIIYQNKDLRERILSKQIHKHLGFDGVIATDSGAFQQYIYNEDRLNIKAEDIEAFQENIGADFAVILDVPVQPHDDYETAKQRD